MTIAYLCVLIASMLPIIWAGYAKIHTGFNMKDNNNPRELLKKAQGAGKRANWAQANSWEAFAPFAAAIIIASQVGISQLSLDITAIVFVFARVLHGMFYIMDWAKLRSLAWSIGISSNFFLYFLVWRG